MTDELLEYRCTIVLPQAKVYPADYVLDLMALAVRNRDNDGPPDSENPPIFRWDANIIANAHCGSSEPLNKTSFRSRTVGQSPGSPEAEDKRFIWDDKAVRIQFSLMKELYRLVQHGHLTLWSLFCDTTKEPPSDLNNLRGWVMTANIYLSNLTEFCRREKIKVVTEQTAPQPEDAAPPQKWGQSKKNSKEGETRQPHWADSDELARAFPAVESTPEATLAWFKEGASDRKRRKGFKEAYIENTGGRGRGKRSQYNIFVIAGFLLDEFDWSERSIRAGLQKHLGAALDDYEDELNNIVSRYLKPR